MGRVSNKRKKVNQYSKINKILKINEEPEILRNETLLVENNNESVEIIDLNEKLESDENDESEDKDDWEDVSEFEEVIKINFQNIDKDSKLDERREILKLEREKRESIHRVLLMCLISRLRWINKVAERELIRNIAFSIVPTTLIDKLSKTKTAKEIKDFVFELLSLFQKYEINNKNGDVEEMLKLALESRKCYIDLLNVLVMLILRTTGIVVRLVGILYLTSLKCNHKLPESSIIVQPTQYKASTRGKGKHKKKDVDNKKQIMSPQRQTNTKSDCNILLNIEILIPNTLQWLVLDVTDFPNSWDNISRIRYKRPKFLYAIAVHDDGFVRDVTPRYDSLWATVSRRQRLPESSLSRILSPITRSGRREEDMIEDVVINEYLKSQPMPTTLADFKGHPIYVLEPNLLKYEVLCPPNVSPVNHFRGKKVFLRENVKLAHTRETWLKEAMSVKSNEKPCKRVKTIMSAKKCKDGRDPLVDLWGPWQVENYVPPVAQDGKVPVNKHGNVDMFKPCMLPIGCVHIRLNDVNKVASHLGIHCVPAMIGWAFTKTNHARPILDGFIVCIEHVDTLKQAWREWKMKENAKIGVKRREKAMKNWSTIIRRLKLRERLREKYDN